MKQIIFDSNARKEIQSFPKEIKLELGKLLLILQRGESLPMPTSRPMPSIYIGALELRLRDESGNYRVFYYTKVKDKLIVFHAFMKKDQKTPMKEIDIAKQRLNKLLAGENS